jgi:putative Holliday junction resolvase
MARIMSVDWGTVRVGVAMTDEEQKLAFPLQHTLETKTAGDEIRKLTEEYQIERILVGLPLSLQGQQGESAQKAQKFGDDLAKRTGLQVEYVDERFSSVASTQALHEQDIKEKDQRQIKDNISAALLLQQYLDNK